MKPILVAALVFLTNLSNAFAQNVEPYIESVEQVEHGMTIWQLIQAGGFIMVVIGLLSIVTLAFIIYFFMSFKVETQVPLEFSRSVIAKLAGKKYAVVKQLCVDNENIISRVVLSGLSRFDKGTDGAAESAEIAAKNEVSKLWERLSYLSDLAAVAPFVGLLGTVLGMMQAFNTIAFQSAAVKPMLLAGGVSKAMVTTAGGLSIAIPAMLFYAFFRSRITLISGMVEALTTEIVDVFAGLEKKR